MTLALTTARLALALPTHQRADAARCFHLDNAAHLARWSPARPEGYDTSDYWHDYVEKSRLAFAQGALIRLWIAPNAAPDKVIGTIGFSQITRGAFCSAVLGYQLAEEFQGQGMMYEALQCALGYAFCEQKLHRISANYRPENVRSGRLLKRLGFQIEGFARDYLFIDGAWRDHVLTSLTNGMLVQPEITTGRA